MLESKNRSQKADDLGLFNADSISSCFGPDFLDESFCRRMVIDLIYSGVPGCNFCGFPLPEKKGNPQRFYENKTLYCANF